MSARTILATLTSGSLTAALALCASARADHVSLTGPGGPIVDNPGPPAGGVWPGVLAPVSFASVVVAPGPIVSVISVVISEIAHSYVGDLQIVLVDPMGVGHNLMVRPGAVGAAGTNAGDFAVPGQNIAFVAAGGATVHAAGDLPTGVYDQYFGPVGDMWPAGAFGIINTPMGAIAGPAGVWTLVIYDWAPIDLGAVGSWTLNGMPPPAGPGVAYCTPGIVGVIACPCANPPIGIDHGCDNSDGTGGAQLVASGTTFPDTVVLTSSGELPFAISIFLQGDAAISGVPFGDGVRCVGGSLKRLYIKAAVLGVVSAPTPGEPSITAQSAGLGDPIAPGSTRYYQVYYRDPALAFCPFPVGNTWNVSNGMTIIW